MDQREYEITEEEKGMSYIKGVVTGIISTLVIVAIVLTLIKHNL